MDVDLNADVGEGLSDDERLLDVVTSASVACGAHAGSVETMRVVCAAAALRGVAIGAHPSFRDREGFGRRVLEIAPDELRADVALQVAALVAIAATEGAAVTYLKPHGALYDRAIDDGEIAAVLVDVAREFAVAVLGWPKSQLLERAHAAGLAAVPEGFADRGYEDGRLVPRTAPGALLAADEAPAQAVALAGDVRSICVHGDTPGSAALAAGVRSALLAAGYRLRAFA